MSQSSSSPQTPAVRTFQMDGSTQGSLASSVNLFRGDVNLTQTLLTLPGRSGDGLDVSIAIQYQSNVFREATTWNADAPTGVLGLGWSLPLTWIEAEAGPSPVAAARQYVFHDNGSANRLFRQPLVPALFTASATLAAGLADGAGLPTAVREQFRGLGLAVSSGAVVRGAGPWTVDDDALMQSYVLALENGLLVARDGGETYQLQSYQFWKVLYYPSYERWVVISESGMRRTFGGRAAATPQGFATSLGNSVAWSVYWSDGAGRPVWTGPSNQTAGQVQVARAWYLHEIRDRFGSAVVHTYNGGARTASGILPVAEQQVGVGGKPHTRAVYLDTITDSFGRTIRFKYAAKLCNDNVREYVDPHREPPSDAPGPYQDRYETQYLAGVDVDSATGTRLYSFVFDYAPRPGLNGAARAVADVAGGAGQRDRFKRLLTSVTQRDRDGVASPAIRFTYDLGPNTAGGQPGALLGVTPPQGGTARYTYARHDLPLCDRRLVVDRPAGVPDGATSRVFHGPDYAVVCWYNQTWGQLSLQVYTWTGRWVAWSPGASPVIDTSGLSLETLRVHAQADFLAVSFNRPNGDLPLYVFQRDAAKPGQWRAGTVDGVTAGVDRPNVVYKAQGMAVELRGGDTFLVVGQMNPATLSGSHDVLTWRWTTQTWTRAATNLARYSWIAAGAEWFAVLGNDGRLTLSYLDGAQTWRQAAPVQLAGLALDKLTNIRMVAGAGMLVVANLTASSAQQHSYRLHTVQWSGDYTASVASHGPFTDAFGANNAPLSWTPTLVKDTLVAVNGNLLRRVGGAWSVDTSLNLANPPGGTAQRFAYASDCVVRVCVPTSGTPTAEVVAYDPTAAAPWTRATPSVALSPQTSPRDNWPFAGDGDWLIIGPYAWFRGAATSWAQCVARPPAVNLASAVRDGTGDTYARFYSESLVDQAPGFWAFTVEQGGSQSAHAIVLRNGGVAQYCRFAGEKLYTASSGGAGGAGVSAAGPRSFTAFPANYPTLDGAQSVMIHRYAGHAVDGAITHYTVVAAELDDGFGQRLPIAYAPDLATAAADTSGDVVKFYQTTVYPGSSGAPYAPYGSIVSRYLNGAAEKTGDQFDDALDGLLIATDTRAADGALLESVRSTWGVFRQVAASATDPNAPAVQLRGAWVTQAAEERMKDGIVARKLIAYTPTGFTLPVTGQPVVEALASVGGSGVDETFTRVVRHGVHHYASLWAIHALADVVQVDTLVNQGGGAVLQSASVTGYSSWPSNAGDGVRTPAPAAGFSLRSGSAADFPFAAWSPGQRPGGWLLTTQTTRRTRYGQETACVDASGVAATTITDRKATMPVASIANAAPIECAYLGFQDYEDTSDWTLTKVTYDKSDACAGTRSAVLAGDGSAAIGVSVRPTRPDTWFVGCRFRTLAGFVADGSGLAARVDLGNGQSAVVSLAWTATSGAWTYVTLPVPVAATSMDGVGTITVTARNTAGSAVWVDSVVVAPLVTAATMRTFDPDSQQVLAASDASGRLTRTFYDRTFQPVVSVGPTGLVREITGSSLSRAGSAADAFDPAAPNVELTLHTAGGGVLESFRDGKLWTTRWSPAAAQEWSLGNGALVHTLAASSAITWATRPTGTYAIYFEPQTNDAAAAIALAAGDVKVQWSGAGWSAQQAGVAWTRLGARTTAATHWLLVVGDGVVCFFADGQLLFSRRARPVGNTVTLGVAGTVRLRNLTGVQDIRLGLSYNDAGGRQRQIHQLRGDDSLVCAVVFDALDRRLATTRSAPGSFGSGAAVAPLAYRPGFLDVAAFLQATASSWIMSGDVADYYRGQSEGEIARSNDQGYPYHGVRYEASPRSVQVEVGQPGRELAIDLTVPKQSRRTVQVDYGVNAAPVGAMPTGQYRETRVTSAVKTVATRLLDRLEQQVSASQTDASGTLMARSVGVRSYAATGAGPTTTFVQQLPNAQVPGPQGDGAAHVRTLVADALRQTTSFVDVDTGRTRFLYDSAGNLRFVQPAMDAGEQWYVFYRYDALGRQVAEGIVKGAWDPAWLQQRLDDRQWPSGVDPTVTVIVSTEYDGPGDVPTLIGRRWRTTTSNPAPSSVPGAGNITVKEEFAYAVGGEVVRATQTVSGAVKASGALGYAYNALGELVRVDLPAGCPFAAIFYRYDDHGDIAAIGSAAGGSELGTFTYNADRQPQGWSVSGWTRALEYTSQGWLKSQVTRSTVGGESFAVDLAYEADGALSSRRVNYAFSGYASNYDDSFAYDGRRRLTSAAGSSDNQFTSYDPNGNLWACRRNGRPSSFSHVAGTNRVQSASVEGAAASPLTWNARGQLTSGLGRSFEYVPATGRTRAITTGAARLALAYGAAQQRVVKQDLATGRVNVYFRGAGQVPIATLVNGAWRVTVCGPLGPVAWVADRTYYLLTDATGSVWGAVADGALSFATAWAPFGSVGASHGDSTAVPYGFQGHEWDREVGLFDFGARLYDPALCRMLAPDPQCQYPSPYVFAGGDPLTMVDPTGELSLAAKIGIGAAMVGLAAAGVALTVATAGASAPAMTAAGTALASSMTAGQAASMMAVGTTAATAAGTAGAVPTAAVVMAAGAVGGAAASAGVATSSQVMAGVSTTASATSMSAVAGGTAGSTMLSAGLGGLNYTMMHGQDFKTDDFFKAVGIGAAAGFAGGVVTSALMPLTQGVTVGLTGMRAALGDVAIGAAIGATSGATSGSVSSILTNVGANKPWYRNLAQNALKGAATSASAAGPAGAVDHVPREAIAKRAAQMATTTAQRARTLPQLAKAAARSDTAYWTVVLGSDFMMMGFLIGGVATGKI